MQNKDKSLPQGWWVSISKRLKGHIGRREKSWVKDDFDSREKGEPLSLEYINQIFNQLT
jgi:hypothetical protein